MTNLARTCPRATGGSGEPVKGSDASSRPDRSNADVQAGRYAMVTVRYGPDVLARQLGFGSATSYTAVSAGAQVVRFTAPGEHTATPVTVAGRRRARPSWCLTTPPA